MCYASLRIEGGDEDCVLLHCLCKKGQQEKMKKTNLERWGVEYPIQNSKIQAKMKKTNVERCGFENPTQDPEVKKKTKKTNRSVFFLRYFLSIFTGNNF